MPQKLNSQFFEAIPQPPLLPAMEPQSIPVPREAPALLHDWISRGDLAEELGICVETLRRWADARRGPKFIRAGRKILYRRATVLAWLEAQETNGALEREPATCKHGHRRGSSSSHRLVGRS